MLSDVVVDGLIEVLPRMWADMIIGFAVPEIGVEVLVGVNVNTFVAVVTTLKCAPLESFSCWTACPN